MKALVMLTLAAIGAVCMGVLCLAFTFGMRWAPSTTTAPIATTATTTGPTVGGYCAGLRAARDQAEVAMRGPWFAAARDQVLTSMDAALVGCP